MDTSQEILYFDTGALRGNTREVNRNKKPHFFLNVNVFSTKVIIGETIFTAPTGDGTAIST